MSTLLIAHDASLNHPDTRRAIQNGRTVYGR